MKFEACKKATSGLSVACFRKTLAPPCLNSNRVISLSSLLPETLNSKYGSRVPLLLFNKDDIHDSSLKGKEYILVLKLDNVATILDPSILLIILIINDTIAQKAIFSEHEWNEVEILSELKPTHMFGREIVNWTLFGVYEEGNNKEDIEFKNPMSGKGREGYMVGLSWVKGEEKGE
ncbi:hypothetical protein JHK87_024656 [Glycine soja]|nr:hypothetical protein JHK87_024656 [Glycine soja]